MSTSIKPSVPDSSVKLPETELASFRKSDVWVCILLFALTACVFFPALAHDFVEWDDDISVYRNPHIQGLAVENLRWMFTDVSYSLRYKPLSWLCYALIYRAWGLNPFGYHLAGLVFQAANVALLYLVLRHLLAAGFGHAASRARSIRVVAALAALLWGLNPLRVETVVWATAVNYGQSLLFTLLSLLCYFEAVKVNASAARHRRWLWWGVGLFALAMLTYPVVFSFAVVLVVLDVYPLRRFSEGKNWWRDATARKLYWEKAPFFLVAGLLFVSFYGIQHAQGMWAASRRASLTQLERVMQAAYVLVYYLWKPWAPIHLMPVYTTLVKFDPLTWPFILSLICVIVLTLWFFQQRKRWPVGLAGWICYLVLMVPALGLTQHPHYTSDRYDHIPGILWSVVIAAGCVKFCATETALFRAAGILAILVLASAIASYRQTGIWANSPTLFQHMITQLGDDPYRADIYMRLGHYDLTHDHIPESIAPLKEAIRLEPRMADAQQLLGAALLAQGQVDDAIVCFQAALNYRPDFSGGWEGYGRALSQKGLRDQAIEALRNAVKTDPNNESAREMLASVIATPSGQPGDKK